MQQDLVQQHLIVERIFGHRIEPSEMYLCKWSGLPYELSTWESVGDLQQFSREISDFIQRSSSVKLPKYIFSVDLATCIPVYGLGLFLKR